MRVFEHANLDGWVCPVCSTDEDKPVTLIGIYGTREGGIEQALQVHLDCLDLVYIPPAGDNPGMFVQIIGGEISNVG